MEIPDELLCVYSAQVERQDGSYRIVVPEREISDGVVECGESYRVALLGSASPATDGANPESEQIQDGSVPPVEVGDRRIVEIEGIGEQGDGIARVERGYVIIVPDTEKHERVTIEISNVTENVAFAEVVGRKPYYK